MSLAVIPTCIGCGKEPGEISEYVHNPENMPPVEFVIQEEGTYNRFVKDKFYCTSCYCRAGCPTASRRR